jgi:uncharacterized protein YndB with AHSA1/START domain
MPSILHNFPIEAPVEKVFAAAATPKGLDVWWTLSSKGTPKVGETYELFFGEKYDWRGRVTKCTPNKEIEWELTVADKDWTGSRVGLQLEEKNGVTHVRFHHSGWKEENGHFRKSSFCWAMYLRIMKRYVEFGEKVEYDKRLEV